MIKMKSTALPRPVRIVNSSFVKPSESFAIDSSLRASKSAVQVIIANSETSGPCQQENV